MSYDQVKGFSHSLLLVIALGCGLLIISGIFIDICGCGQGTIVRDASCQQAFHHVYEEGCMVMWPDTAPTGQMIEVKLNEQEAIGKCDDTYQKSYPICPEKVDFLLDCVAQTTFDNCYSCNEIWVEAMECLVESGD